MFFLRKVHSLWYLFNDFTWGNVWSSRGEVHSEKVQQLLFYQRKHPPKKKNLLSPPSQFNHQMWLSAPQKNTHHYPVITGARPETAAPVHVVLPLRCCHEKAPRQWWVVPARHARPNEECLDGEFNCQLLPSLKMKHWGWKMSFILEWRGMAGAMYYAT